LLRSNRGAGCRDIGLAGANRGLALLNLFAAGSGCPREGLRSAKLGPCIDQGRLGTGDLRTRLVKLGLCRPRVDCEQCLPGADILPVGEVDALEVARHSRLDLDFLNRLQQQFIALYTADGIRLINSRLIERVRPLD
jgi:hypothetical protein